MVTPELSQYVNQQIASGCSPADIRAALITSGWPAVDADQALSSITPAAPGVPSPTTTPPQAASKGKGLAIILWVLLLILLGGGAYAAYLYLKRPTTGTHLTSTTSTSSPVATATATAATSTISTTPFTDTGVQFSYDSSWKKIGISALASGNLDNPTPSSTPETQYLFFTPSNYVALKKEVADFQANPSQGAGIFDLIIKAGFQSDFTLTREAQTSAQDSARQATQSVCTGTDVNYSTDNPVVESRIQPTTVGSYKGYMILPQSGCTYKTTQLFLDASSTSSAPTPIVSTAPGVTITGGSQTSSSNDSFILNFNNANDLQHLSPSQQVILNSIKLP